MAGDVLNVLRETAAGSESPADVAERFIRRFVAMSDAQAAVITLFVLHTHLVDAADTTPYIAVTSAEKQSGKTRLLEVLELLVARPLRAAGATEAALFRALAEEPTLLIDEVDAVFGAKARKENAEGLRALLNSGFRRGNPILRVVGEREKKVERFEVFGPKVLSGIGDLPDTVADRALPIRLKRRAPGEWVERFRYRDARRQAEPIRNALERWAKLRSDTLADARPLLPDQLDDRAQDVAEPLLAIADELGGDWPARARQAVVEVKTGDDAEASISERLLHDLRECFREQDELTTHELLLALFEIEESPWIDWWAEGRSEEPTPNRGAAMRLARHLKPLGVRSHNLRRNERVVKGYRRTDLQDAFRRYLPDTLATSLQPLSHKETRDTEVATEQEVIATSHSESSAQQSRRSDVATFSGNAGARRVDCALCGSAYDPGNTFADLVTCPACVALRRGVVTESEADEMRMLAWLDGNTRSSAVPTRAREKSA